MQGQSRDDRKVDCQIPHREKESVQKVMTGTCHQRGTAQDIEPQALPTFSVQADVGKVKPMKHTQMICVGQPIRR